MFCLIDGIHSLIAGLMINDAILICIFRLQVADGSGQSFIELDCAFFRGAQN
jgi:hypothetical protein